MTWKDDEIKELMIPKEARAIRNRIDRDVWAERKKREKIASFLLQIRDEEEFREELEKVIADYGQQFRPEERAQMIQIWREHHLG